MIKSNRFVFVAMIVVAFLLIVGNWTTPVQANRTDVVTPTPSVTPITDPTNQGNPVSVEQQEELKGVIQSYFEIRYQALSVSQSADFQLKGFGNLVSDGADAKAFLDAELGKLAVDIKHAELNRLRYVQYKYFLEFINFAIDTSSQLATVKVVEEHDVIDEISMESSPENPFVSHRYNQEHTIVLRKEQGQWKIVSDDYTDYLWHMLRQTGISTTKMLNSMKAFPKPSLQSKSAEITTVSPLPPDTSTHDYNRAMAVEYANNHANNYNLEDYETYTGLGGDCTNFVSQAIYEGGNASMFIPSPLPAPSPGGQSGWYFLNEGQRASAWNDVGAFYTFVTSESLLEAQPGVEWYGEGPQGYTVAINEIQLGDVIQYDWDGDGTWDHAAMVVDFVGTDPIVATHSPDDIRQYTAFAPSYNPNITQIRFIHIERSNGYPPVKAEIIQGSNDAGTNPLLACNFSLGHNEAYFGLCPNGSSVTSGFRFTDIEIPQGAQIKYAYLTFSVDGPYSAPLDVNIYGEAAANSVTFSAVNPPANRSTPNTPVLWNITDQWILGMRRTTPQLSSVIQNIIGPTTGWQSGNPLTFIFKNPGPNTNMRRVIAYERANVAPNLAPAKLIAAYSFDGIPPPTSTPITPTSTPVPTSTPTFTPVPTNTPTPVPTNPPSQPTFCNICGSGCSPNLVQQLSGNEAATLSFTETADLLYRVRDEILSATPEGQRLTDLYYTYIPNIIQVLIENPDLSDQSMEILDLFIPSLQALVDGNGDTVTITSEQVNSLQSFLDALVENGDPELQSVILSELENHPIADMAGMTMDQAWTYLNNFPSTPVLDDFNRANGAMGHNWSGNKSKYTINANQLKVISNASNSDVYWTGQAFGADQEAYVTFSDVSATATEQDLLLKSQSNTSWGHGVLEVLYDAPNQRAQVWTYEWHAGWVKHGADIPVTFVDGDQFGARAFANGTVEVYKNGTLLATRDITSWLYYDQGGYIGLWFIGAQNARVDDFGGGTLSGGQQSMLAGPPSRSITSDQLNVTANSATQFWQGVPTGTSQTASVTFTSLQASVKPQSNGVWGEGTIQVLYDIPNQRIQVWMYDTTKSWTQIGKDIPVKFTAGDAFTVRILSDGTLEISRNGKVLVKRKVSP